jgi:hypothetical protein
MGLATFEWGWDALVAIGTIALAAGTFLLALSTRRAAKASAEDVRAQWRPVVVPSAEFDDEFEELAIKVHNVGRGAAYYIDAALGIDGTYWPARDLAIGQRMATFAVVPPAADLRLAFECSDGLPREAEILIDYTDLNGRPYSTRIELELNTSMSLQVARVELSDNRERIPWKPWTWEPETRREWLRSKLPKRQQEAA